MAAARPPQLDHRIPHGRQVHDGGYAGEILENHAGGRKRDFRLWNGLRVPGCQRADIARRDSRAVLMPEEILQKDLERIGKPVNAFIANGIEAKDIVAGIVHRQALTGSEGICHLRDPQVWVDLTSSLPRTIGAAARIIARPKVRRFNERPAAFPLFLSSLRRDSGSPDKAQRIARA